MSEEKPKLQEEILAKDRQWAFDSLETFYITGRGKCFVVACPINCNDFDWIVNREVTIDGKPHKIIGIERFMHMPPWKKGEKISLLIADFGSL